MISQLTGLPARFVRKEAKTYGTCRLAEGGELDGQRLCIVEDVVTSGGAILDAAVELRARGAILGPVICVIDRESGGTEKLAADGLDPAPALPDARAQARLAPSFTSALRGATIAAAARAPPALGSLATRPSRRVAEPCRHLPSTTHFAASGATPAATSWSLQRARSRSRPTAQPAARCR